MFADSPAEPTRTLYVRMAGVLSLPGFSVNYPPTCFGVLLARMGKLFAT